MKIMPRRLPGLAELELQPFRDARGGLVRAFDALPFADHGLPVAWQQMLLSHTDRRCTLRGLHVQLPPYTEAKLLVPVSGRMAWAVVDLRHDSPSRWHWDIVVLDPDRSNALFVPRGFAHGCLSLSDRTTVAILTDNVYAADHGLGIAWNDPDLAIDWPLDGAEQPFLSPDHAAFPPLAAVAGRLADL